MNTAIARKTSIQDTDNLIVLINDVAQLEGFSLSKKRWIMQQNAWIFEQNELCY